jgi:hypothetical protein
MTVKSRELCELDEQAIAEMLTSKIPENRVKGRLLATGVIDNCVAFWKSEDERNTVFTDIVSAINEVCAAVVGSMLVSRIGSRPTHKRLTHTRLAVAMLADMYRRDLEDLIRLSLPKSGDDTFSNKPASSKEPLVPPEMIMVATQVLWESGLLVKNNKKALAMTDTVHKMLAVALKNNPKTSPET